MWAGRFYFDLSGPSNLPELNREAYVYNVNKSAQVGTKSFLGRIRIAGTSYSPGPDETTLQYRELEKSWLRHRMSGGLGMAVYIISDPSKALTPPLPGSVISSIPALLLQEDSRLHDITLQHLKEITNNLSDERIIGQGGFGVVYMVIRLQNIFIVCIFFFYMTTNNHIRTNSKRL